MYGERHAVREESRHPSLLLCIYGEKIALYPHSGDNENMTKENLKKTRKHIYS